MQFDTRIDMIRALVPTRGVIGEIGVFKCDFARQLVNVLHPKRLVLFDLFEGPMCSGDVDGNDVTWCDMGEMYLEAQKLGEAVKGDSSTSLSTFEDDTFDMLYIDGDHSYEGVRKDLEQAYKKVKPGGWIMGHDYEMNMNKAKTKYDFGVKKAVDEFCAQKNLVIHAKGLDGCVSFAIRKRLKVAVLISGRLTCEQTRLIPQVMNSKEDIHVFASLNVPSEDREMYKNRLEKIHATVRCEPYTVPSEYLNHPKKAPETSAQNMMSMYYHSMKAFEMMGDEHFDVVIRFRPDIISDSLPPLNELEPGCVYIPLKGDWGGLNDRTAYGDKDVMRTYCDIYKHIDDALRSDPTYRLHPETLLAYHMRGIPVKRVEYDTALDENRR